MKVRVIILMVLFMLSLTLPVFAGQQVIVQDREEVKIVIFKLNDFNYYVQDADGNIKTIRMDTTPYVESYRIFVPVKFLGNALGLADEKIKWNNTAKTATLIGKKTLVLTLGSNIMKSDGDSVTMDVSQVSSLQEELCFRLNG